MEDGSWGLVRVVSEKDRGERGSWEDVGVENWTSKRSGVRRIGGPNRVLLQKLNDPKAGRWGDNLIAQATDSRYLRVSLKDLELAHHKQR